MSEKRQSWFYYIKLLMPYIRKDKWLFLLGLGFMLLTSALRLLDPLILAHIIDDSIPNQNMADMLRYGFLFVGLVIMNGALTYLQMILMARVGIRIITKFKGEVFSHLLKLPVSWFDKQPVGELIARVESDSERVKALFSELSITILGNIMFFVGVFVVLFIRQSKTTLIMLPAIVLTIVAYSFLVRYLSKFYRRLREKVAEISARITDYVQGMNIIQVFNQQERVIRDLATVSLEKKKLETRTSFFEYGSNGIFLFIFNVLFVILIIWISAPKIIAGVLTIGTLVIFIQYIYRLIWPLMHISENIMQIQRSFVSLHRILDLTELPCEDDIYQGKDLPYFEEEIVFENVWFAYKNEDWVLKDVSFSIPKGKRIALVGASGSGKSTTIGLLCGFYPLKQGRILIDGTPLSKLNFRLWREKIGLIMQEIILFPGSILENVRVYNDEVSAHKVKEATSIVQLDDFIRMQENGMDTELAERGQNISQGEKQLISFARALAFEPELIIMDEATASIDPQTESKIQRTMDKVLKNKTALIVAHRLTSVLDADQILLFRDGEIIDRGNHNQLMKSSEEYRKLVELQLLKSEAAGE